MSSGVGVAVTPPLRVAVGVRTGVAGEPWTAMRICTETPRSARVAVRVELPPKLPVDGAGEDAVVVGGARLRADGSRQRRAGDGHRHASLRAPAGLGHDRVGRRVARPGEDDQVVETDAEAIGGVADLIRHRRRVAAAAAAAPAAAAPAASGEEYHRRSREKTHTPSAHPDTSHDHSSAPRPPAASHGRAQLPPPEAWQLLASKNPATSPALTVKRWPLASLPEKITLVW